MLKKHAQAGFSLLELAIVLMIVGLLLGGLIMPLSARMDQQKIDTSRQQLEQIRQALIGYALARDALPCPATPASSSPSSFRVPGRPSVTAGTKPRWQTWVQRSVPVPPGGTTASPQTAYSSVGRSVRCPATSSTTL